MRCAARAWRGAGRGAASLLAAACLAFATPAASQTVPGAAQQDAGDAESQAKQGELREQIARLESRTAEWQAKADEYQQAQRDAAARNAEIAAEIAQLRGGPDVRIPESATLDQIEVLVLGGEQDLLLAQREVAERGAERDRHAERRQELPGLLADAKARLANVGEPPPPVAGEDAAISDLRRTLHERSRAALEAEVRAYEQELLSHEARSELLEQQILRATLRAENVERRLERLREIASERRQELADREIEQALDSIEQAASLAPGARELVRQLAQENAELARVRTGEDGLRDAIDEVSRKLSNVERQLSELDADYERLTQRVASAGLTDSVGLLLRRTRSEAPDVGKYRRFIRMRSSEIVAVENRQDELREELDRLSDIDEVVAATLDRFAPDTLPADRAQLESLLRDLLETRQKHVAALLADYEVLFQKLVDFDARQQELIEKTETLLRFIDARVLWIPSGRPARWKTLADSAEAVRWFAETQHWGQLWRAFVAVISAAPLLNLGAVAVLAGSIPLVRRLRPRLHTLAVRARAPTHVDVSTTLEALAITVLAAPWAPLALAWLGWRLEISPAATLFVRAVAGGALAAAFFWLTLQVPREILRRDGVAVAHFGWPEQAVRDLRRELGWVTAVLVPLVFVIQVFEVRGEDAARESLGRLAFMIAAFAGAAFMHRILREGGALRAILRGFERFRGGRWMWRSIHWMALAGPIALIVAAGSGYTWTALQLGASFHLTAIYLFVLLVLLHLALRWSLVARRRLAFEQWRKERDEALAALANRVEGEPVEERPLPEEPELDLGTVDVQTGRLLSTSAIVAMLFGLWFLWADLVPAVGMLDSVDLWTQVKTQTVEVTNPDGSKQFQAEERVVAVTLADLLAAVIALFMTSVLVRNLPGLLEISLFRRLGTAPGERYAYSTLAKYAITVAGFVFAFNTLGIDWSNVQWLVAAVGVGLGFGLQEIFANFVSGLILLFERPIRVGDTVNIGDVSGTVAKIRTRATWLVGPDRKEIVVPNKQLVTSPLVNASLRDPITRVTVPIGIAYGCDAELAMRELLRVAQGHENVLAEPKPQVLFVGFGESSLNLELHAYCELPHNVAVKNDLHVAVDRAFRDAHIEIPFPQRDIHIRTAPPGWGRADEKSEG